MYVSLSLNGREKSSTGWMEGAITFGSINLFSSTFENNEPINCPEKSDENKSF